MVLAVRNRIVSACMERMAPQDTFYAKPCAGNNSVAFDGIMGILRAGRVESASRNTVEGHRLVQPYTGKDSVFHDVGAPCSAGSAVAADTIPALRHKPNTTPRKLFSDNPTAPRRNIKIISIPGASRCLLRRNISRNKRLTRLRSAAMPTLRLVISPNRRSSRWSLRG
jgi:hypothetical protein